MAVVIILKAIIFELSSKTLRNAISQRLSRLKILENLPTVTRKSVFSVLGLERVCPRKDGPWPRIFLSIWPWPQTLCPQLHLCRSAKPFYTGVALPNFAPKHKIYCLNSPYFLNICNI